MICARRRRCATAATATRVATVVALVAAVLVGTLGPAADPARAAEATPPSSPTPGETTAPQEGEEEPSPLTVTLSSMAPAVVPRRGPVRLEGSIRNDSEERWEDVNVLSFLGATPLTTREEVAEAAATTGSTDVGARLDLPGSFVGLEDLEPGAEAPFSVRVPRQALPAPDAVGVYWIGIHALGTNAEGRDGVADGRARTLIPVVSPRTSRSQEVPVSVVVPVRQPALRADDGSLARPQSWVGPVTARLQRLADFAASSGTQPLTWLVDPAVLDALDDLGQGNPPLSLGPAERAQTEPSPSGDPSGSSSGSPSPSEDEPEPVEPSPEPDAEPEIAEGALPDPQQAAAARTLLDQLVEQGGSGELLALPYADADAVGLGRERPALLERAVRAAEESLGVRGLDGRAVLAPPDGLVDLEVVSRVLPRLPQDASVLMSDQGELALPVVSELELARTATARQGDHDLVLSDARASSGGPAPVEATDPLALRQRVLADAAVEAQQATGSSTTVRPIVVMLPDDYDPGPGWAAADFFGELDTPWIDLAPLPGSSGTRSADDQAVSGRSAATQEVEGEDPEPALPAYPRAARAAELETPSEAVPSLLRRAEALDGLLANLNDVLPRLGGAALQATSYAARERPRASAASVAALADTVDGVLTDVAVFGSEFVTLSSGSGTLTVTLVNDLAQPVTVGVEVRSREDVRAESVEPVELGPEQRATLRLPVVSEEGVHDVELQPVTVAGVAVGEPFDFVLRTSQVGRTVWFVMAAGALVFAVMLLRRVRQRLRERDDRQPAR